MAEIEADVQADIHQDIAAAIPYLRRYARALARDVVAADDLVQECLVRALAKLHLWQEGTNLRAWLVTILHNQHVNNIRRTMRSGRTVELSDAEPLLSRPADQDKRLELRDFERALAQLPEVQRTLIILVGLEGMPYQEAGALLGMPVGTVRSRISRGRDALRRLMGAGLDPPPGRASLRAAAKAPRRPRPATPALAAISVAPGP